MWLKARFLVVRLPLIDVLPGVPEQNPETPMRSLSLSDLDVVSELS